MDGVSKVCFKCGADKPLSEFYKHKEMADGHLNKCKSCTKADVAENYAGKREQYASYDRRRFHHPDRKAKVLEYQRRRRARFPDKNRARQAISNGIASGKIVRPESCSVCGKVGKVQAHHHDYSKPLDVIWECFQCHREREHGQVVTAKDYQ